MGRSDHAYDDWYDDAGTWPGDHTEASRRLEMLRTPDVQVGMVVPHEFGDAQEIADRVRRDELALVDLRECSPILAARLTDFCSGLAYALDGGLQIVADGVLLVSPGYVDVSGDEASAVREPGFFNRL
jgi:cell division inhibitor SepF